MSRCSRPGVALLCLSLAVLAAAFAAGPAAGQAPSLVADLASGAQAGDGGSFPTGFFAAGERLYFAATAPSTGQELYTTDGTGLGSELLADICPGTCSSAPRPLVRLSNGRLLFAASSAPGRRTLWSTDGTRAGTFALADASGAAILPDPEHPNVEVLGAFAYLDAMAEGGTATIYRTDGSRAGTRPLSAVLPGLPADLLRPVVNDRGRLYFFSSAPFAAATGLWRSDGTPAGTGKLVDLPFRPLYPTAPPSPGNELVFLADSTEQLWTTDGTAAGTRQASSFPAAHPFGPNLGQEPAPSPFVPSFNALYFIADDGTHGEEVWSFTFTGDVTRVSDLAGRPTRLGSSGHAPPVVVSFGLRQVFLGSETPLGPPRLWSAASPGAATTLLAGAVVDPAYGFVQLGAKVLFAEASAFASRRLWETDGTPAGTHPFDDCGGPCTTTSRLTYNLGHAFFLHQGALWSAGGGFLTRRLTDPGALDTASLLQADLPVALISELVFFAGVSPDYGSELWTIEPNLSALNDPKAQPAPRVVANLARTAPSSSPADLAFGIGGRLFFSACPDGRREVFRSEGTAATTVQLTTAGPAPCNPAGDAAIPMVTTGSRTFFARTEADGQTRLWVSDGTAAGTRIVSTPPLAAPPQLANTGDRVYFATTSGTSGGGSGLAVWASDGTPAGTGPAFDFGSPKLAVRVLQSIDFRLYLVVENPSHGLETWVSDGTLPSTRQLNVEPGPVLGFGQAFAAPAGATYFAGKDADHGVELWRTDGTPENTVRVTDLLPGIADSLPSDLTALPGKLGFFGQLYFFAAAPGGGRALYRIYSTNENPVVLKTFPGTLPPGVVAPSSFTLALAGSALRYYFAADDGIHGEELWTTDGTPEGTALVRDLYPGPLGSHPRNLVSIGSRLYFTADDGVHGAELWSAQGGNVQLVADVAPEAASSSPGPKAASATQVFFAADDGLHGRELWVLPATGSTACQAADDHLCVNDNRFRVEVAWKDFQGHTGTGHAVALTADTGYFWFFSPGNVEVILKMLDARSLSQSFWVFYGALSTVEYTITVTDTQTGLTRRYFNPSGNLASVADTAGFGPLGAFGLAETTLTASPSPPALPATTATTVTAATGCVPSPTRLCLQGGRFAVEADWKDFSNHTGTGTAIPLTADTGYFWFFSAANVEVVLKVLDGRPLNGKFWVFYGALSSVEYTLRVTDTQTGVTQTYKNRSGQLGSVADTAAF